MYIIKDAPYAKNRLDTNPYLEVSSVIRSEVPLVGIRYLTKANEVPRGGGKTAAAAVQNKQQGARFVHSGYAEVGGFDED